MITGVFSFTSSPKISTRRTWAVNSSPTATKRDHHPSVLPFPSRTPR